MALYMVLNYFKVLILIWLGFLFLPEYGGVKLSPAIKYVRIMLETSNFTIIEKHPQVR